MKKLLAFALMLIAYNGIAQDTEKAVKRIGLDVGYNSSEVLLTANGTEDFNSAIEPQGGLNIGFFTEQGQNKYFTTYFGMFYQQKGADSEGDYSLETHYVQLPLRFNFRMPIAGPVFLKIGAGPYLGFAFTGKEVDGTTTNRDLFGFPKRSGDEEENKPYSPLDVGITFGGTVEYVLPDARTIELSVRYDLGVTSISNDQVLVTGTEPTNLGVKNNVLSINLAYTFDLNSKD